MEKNDNKSEAQLIIEAKLSDVGLPAPKPGVLYSVSLMQYEVLKIIRGNYSHKSILIGHHVPDTGSAAFQTGTIHRLWLTKDFPKQASILNKFQNTDSINQHFFCISFEVVMAR